MRTFLESVSLAAMLAACMPSQLTLPPTQWDPRYAAAFEEFNLATKCGRIRMIQSQVGLSKDDLSILAASLARDGLPRRDIAYALAPPQPLHTGMDGYQVQCEGGYLINDAFYQGAGYQWQMQVGTTYVYLSGDGTLSGMRVTGWN